MNISEAMKVDILYNAALYGLSHREIRDVIEAVLEFVDSQPVQFELVE